LVQYNYDLETAVGVAEIKSFYTKKTINIINNILLKCSYFSLIDCTLRTYSSSYIRGYSGLAVEYEPGFKSSLDTMNSYARDCGITVRVG